MLFFMKRLLIFFLLFNGTAVAEENLPPLTAWPVKIQPVLSSSFAEYRSNHFHAGIDFKTWGKEGYRVYAVEDGSIVRIRTSPWFYGKAVYLKMTTGETAVYAHLSRFIPRLEEVIRKAQRKEDTYEVDVHIPEGATPKDGPSAGISMCTSIVSAITRRPVYRDLAMTGEITLRGRVLPIGGLKEKILAAHRAGIKTLILPKWNEKDLFDIPKNVQKKIRFHFVDRMMDVVKIALIK